jgi:hypothetical protein
VLSRAYGRAELLFICTSAVINGIMHGRIDFSTGAHSNVDDHINRKVIIGAIYHSLASLNCLLLFVCPPHCHFIIGTIHLAGHRSTMCAKANRGATLVNVVSTVTRAPATFTEGEVSSQFALVAPLNCVS